MNFTVNLALRLRENRRRIWIIWGGLFALSFAALLILGAATTANWQAAGSVRRRSAQVEAGLPALVAERSALVRALDRPEMREQWQRARRFNDLIDRKSVSWTRLFERLEALMPAQVQLVSIGPGHGQNAAGDLAITIAAPGIPEALPFVRKLEQSSDFVAPSVRQVSERQEQAQTSGAEVRLQITTEYRPALGPRTYFGKRAGDGVPRAAADSAAGAPAGQGVVARRKGTLQP